MSASDSSSVKPTVEAPPTWYQRNQKEISYVVILTGIALTMISLAVMTVSATVPLGPDIPDGTLYDPYYFDVANLMQSGWWGAASIYLTVLGIGIIAGGLGMLHDASKKAQKLPQKKAEHITKDEAEKNMKHQMRKNILIVIGFAIAMFGVGIILTGSLYINNAIPAVKDLFERAIHEGWEHQDFWQAVNADWIQPASWRLGLMVTAGVITTIAGAGIMASACGYSLCRGCVKGILKKTHEENTVAPENTEDF